MLRLTETNLHPFVRRVGLAPGLQQSFLHKSYDHRLLLPESGNGYLEWNGETVPMRGEELFLIAPGVPYRVSCETNQSLMVINFDWTMDTPEQFGLPLFVPTTRFQPEKVIGAVDWSALFSGKDRFSGKYRPEIKKMAQKMLQEYLSPSEESGKILRLSGLMLQLVAEILHPAPEGKPLASKIHHYICEHFREPLKLQQVAEVFHFHPSYINRVLTEQYGISFRQLLIRCRIQNAIPLLENTQLSAEEIAVAVGFYDGKHFAESFRKQYGRTPSQYR